MNKSKIIAIGALGGSGTRAVAQTLMDSGVCMGKVLNDSNDNLLFTHLLKNPDWYKRVNGKDELIKARMDLFLKIMHGHSLSFKEKYLFAKAVYTNPLVSTTKKNIYSLYKKHLNKRNHILGWKEPNTQFYAKFFLKNYSNFKYVHVIRHGLDMAFSNNKQQLTNWGFLYDIYLDGKEGKSEIAYKQLDFWIKSTTDWVNQKSSNQIFLLNYNKLCNSPKSEIENMLGFLNIDIHESKIDFLSEKIKPYSNNRYKDYDLSIFSKNQLNKVKELGFYF